MSDKVLIISDFPDNIIRLLNSDFKISSVTYSARVMEIVIQNDFDLIIVDCDLSDDFLIKISKQTTSGIIYISNSQKNFNKYGICVISNPTDKKIFSQAVNIVLSVRFRIVGFKDENIKIRSKLEEMKIINRAKFTLMQYLKMSEIQAHKYIEKQAMNTRCTKTEVAQRILKTYET